MGPQGADRATQMHASCSFSPSLFHSLGVPGLGMEGGEGYRPGLKASLLNQERPMSEQVIKNTW